MWAGRREFSLWAEVWGQVALSLREAGTMWWSLGELGGGVQADRAWPISRFPISKVREVCP